MGFSAYALSSGSSGNAVLIRFGENAVLLDAGLSGRELLLRMKHVGFDAAGLRAILVSHEHSDHTCGAGPLARKLKIPLVANPATLEAARPQVGETEVIPLSTGMTLDLHGLLVKSFPIPHDAAEPVGFVFERGRYRICSATDLGEPSPVVREAMAEAHLVILESNHDVRSLLTGPYPEHLKRRIRGPLGHLSNLEAAGLMADHIREHGPACFWLAHLSQTNNTPKMAMDTAVGVLSAENLLNKVKLDVALRDRISTRWHAGAITWQKTLF